MQVWTKEVPKISAYYWIIPKNKDTWLDCSPEVAYLYFDGKWSVLRPGESKSCRVDEILAWCGPLTQPELVEDENGEILQ